MAVFAICGPSGAGKDTLIAALERARPDIRVVRRIVTRPAEAGGEPFVPATEAEFSEMVERGDLALHWRAHGLRYGIPISAMRAAEAGETVLFNASRATLAEAARRFPGLGVILVTASPETLAARLSARGRESAAQIRERLARAPAFELPAGLRVIRSDNDGAIETAAAALIAALAVPEDQKLR